MIKTIAKILLAIAILWTLAFVFKLGNSFALSPEFEKEIYNNCYQDAKLSLGAKRAKQYCTCTTKMLDNKYSDEDILSIGQKSEAEQIQAFAFASNHCNKKANASKKSNNQTSSSENIIKFTQCWDPSGELDGKIYKTPQEYLVAGGWDVWDWEINLSNNTVSHITVMTDRRYKKLKKKKNLSGHKIVKHDVETHQIISASSSFVKIEPVESRASELEITFNLSSGEFHQSTNYDNITYYCKVL